MQISTRADAFKTNSKRYFTNRACRRGHVCERYTSSGQCVECMVKPTGLFVRVSVEVHQEDRVALEMFALEMLRLRGRVVEEVIDFEMSADEREYRTAIVPRFQKAGARPDQVPRGYKTFTLQPGEMPW